MAKAKALISFAVTAKLICVFVFAYAKNRFSHDAAHLHVSKPRLAVTEHDVGGFVAIVCFENMRRKENRCFVVYLYDQVR